MITIKIKRPGKRFWKRMRIPQSFQELTRNQAIAFSVALMVRQCHFDQTFSDEDKFFILATILSDQGLPIDEFYGMGDLAAEELYTAIDPLFTTDHAHAALRYILVHGRKYHFPKYGLQDFPFFRFVVAEDYYANIAEGKDLNANIIGLAAALCIPSWEGLGVGISQTDYQYTIQKITTSRTSIDAKGKLRRMRAIWDSTTDGELYGVLYWYRHTRELLRQDYPAVFSDEPRVKSVDYTSKYRWTAVAEELAGKAFGPAAELDHTNVHRILHHVNYNTDKYKEMEVNQMINGK